MPRVTRPEWLKDEHSLGTFIFGEARAYILQLESDLREKDKAIVRAIRALRFADTPEARMISFTPLAVELKAALTSTAEAEGKEKENG